MCEKELYIYARVNVVGDDVDCNFLEISIVRAYYCKYYLIIECEVLVNTYYYYFH